MGEGSPRRATGGGHRAARASRLCTCLHPTTSPSPLKASRCQVCHQPVGQRDYAARWPFDSACACANPRPAPRFPFLRCPVPECPPWNPKAQRGAALALLAIRRAHLPACARNFLDQMFDAIYEGKGSLDCMLWNTISEI